MSNDYAGPERRTRRVFITHNTEYHLHDGICVAVRDRRTRAFDRDHVAIGSKLEGALAQGEGLAAFHPFPLVGDAMLFQAGNREVHTSPVERVTRPPREVIATYPTM